MFCIIDLPRRKPRWERETSGSNKGSQRRRKADAITRLSALVIVIGLVSEGVHKSWPCSVCFFADFGKHTIKEALNCLCNSFVGSRPCSRSKAPPIAGPHPRGRAPATP